MSDNPVTPMVWTKESVFMPGAEFYSIVGSDGRMLGGEDALFARGEADWLLSLVNAKAAKVAGVMAWPHVPSRRHDETPFEHDRKVFRAGMERAADICEEAFLERRKANVSAAEQSGYVGCFRIIRAEAEKV